MASLAPDTSINTKAQELQQAALAGNLVKLNELLLDPVITPEIIGRMLTTIVKDLERIPNCQDRRRTFCRLVQENFQINGQYEPAIILLVKNDQFADLLAEYLRNIPKEIVEKVLFCVVQYQVNDKIYQHTPIVLADYYKSLQCLKIMLAYLTDSKKRAELLALWYQQDYCTAIKAASALDWLTPANQLEYLQQAITADKEALIAAMIPMVSDLEKSHKLAQGTLVQLLRENGAKQHIFIKAAIDKEIMPLIELILILSWQLSPHELKSFLLLAVKFGHNTLVQSLIAKGASVDATDGSNTINAVSLAAAKGHISTLRLLIEHKANVKAKTIESRNALFFAATYGQLQALEMLLAQQLDVNQSDLYGYTPLMQAAIYDHGDCVAVLIQAKARVDVKSGDCNTPLMLAAKHGALSCLQLLGLSTNVEIKQYAIDPKGDLKAVAEMQATNDKDASLKHYDLALLKAVQGGSVGWVKKLLASGANATVKSVVLRKTALELARSSGFNEIADIISNHITFSAQQSVAQVEQVYSAIAQGSGDLIWRKAPNSSPRANSSNCPT